MSTEIEVQMQSLLERSRGGIGMKALQGEVETD